MKKFSFLIAAAFVVSTVAHAGPNDGKPHEGKVDPAAHASAGVDARGALSGTHGEGKLADRVSHVVSDLTSTQKDNLAAIEKAGGAPAKRADAILRADSSKASDAQKSLRKASLRLLADIGPDAVASGDVNDQAVVLLATDVSEQAEGWSASEMTKVTDLINKTSEYAKSMRRGDALAEAIKDIKDPKLTADAITKLCPKKA
jgi:hypothetical protein